MSISPTCYLQSVGFELGVGVAVKFRGCYSSVIPHRVPSGLSFGGTKANTVCPMTVGVIGCVTIGLTLET